MDHEEREHFHTKDEHEVKGIETGRHSPIAEEDVWEVIDSYFNTVGLVFQQIDSYNTFVDRIRAIIKEAKCIEYKQDLGAKTGKMRHFIVEFGEPRFFKHPVYSDGKEGNLAEKIFPSQARLRSLNYETELTLDCKLKVYEENEEGHRVKLKEDQEYTRVRLGYIPVMVRSKYCALTHLENEESVIQHGECIHDQGGYFVINGGEKVIVAQEKMTDNFVYVFHAKPPSKFSWVAEIRSSPDNSQDMPKSFKVKLTNKSGGTTVSSQDTIIAEITYVNTPIPLIILLRALGYDRDKEIFELICHDMEDFQMMEVLKGSFEGDIGGYQTQEDCLIFIGKQHRMVVRVH